MLKTAILPLLLLGLVSATLFFYQNQQSQSQIKRLNEQVKSLKNEKLSLSSKMASTSSDLKELQGQDQIKINLAQKEEIKNIEKTYSKSVSAYEKLLDLKAQNPKVDKKLDGLLAQAINQLADRKFASADATLVSLVGLINSEQAKLVVVSVPPNPQNVPVNNSAPGSGYSRQTVHTDRGDFVVDIIAADMGGTRVIVDTASDSNCSDNCPVLSLGDYVARNGAFAGVNGSYFCPAEYPSCAGKKNSFDLLAMNKNKHYLNSDNNVYSTNPAVIFGSGYVRFVGKALEWGRDTGVDGVLSNYPLLVAGGNSMFGGNDDPKQSGRGNRSFVASQGGGKVFIGVIRGASVADAAIVLKTLGMSDAMNLDSGGSTALWSGGYKAGPGRNIPNAILFVRK